MPGIVLNEVSFEAEIMAQQAAAENLTSFRGYPFPGQLVEVPYPMENQAPVPPASLVAYSRTHRFSLPKCFHGKKVRLITRCRVDTEELLVTLQCDVRGSGERLCPFFGNAAPSC
ncbi:hypothetical protein CVT26_008574 [Gymnopilus dilepis]|uniref:Uncharacterized protein n=1 Tax=Gymnopilus dilepis TaxID=231916 RepID=A0A409XXR4_9AGAR|nr:hypothetical protein CVT26_008574 [Gymnopilus dilepis]